MLIYLQCRVNKEHMRLEITTFNNVSISYHEYDILLKKYNEANKRLQNILPVLIIKCLYFKDIKLIVVHIFK